MHDPRITNHQPRPWYREPWPWLLMAVPSAAIIGGMVTLWLAVASNDGLVAVDYYKRGLAINQTLAREELARERRYRAQVTFGDDAKRVRVRLSGNGELPAAMRLLIAHPTRAGADQVVALRALAPGFFEGELAAPARGRGLIVIEDAARTWRLSAEKRDIMPGAAVELTAAIR